MHSSLNNEEYKYLWSISARICNLHFCNLHFSKSENDMQIEKWMDNINEILTKLNTYKASL